MQQSESNSFEIFTIFSQKTEESIKDLREKQSSSTTPLNSQKAHVLEEIQHLPQLLSHNRLSNRRMFIQVKQTTPPNMCLSQPLDKDKFLYINNPASNNTEMTNFQVRANLTLEQVNQLLSSERLLNLTTANNSNQNINKQITEEEEEEEVKEEEVKEDNVGKEEEVKDDGVGKDDVSFGFSRESFFDDNFTI
jgi:hypothetical protein